MSLLEMKLPKVLIFSPTYEGKDYCLTEFLDSVNNIDYPNKEFIMIDNSETLDYKNKLESLGVKTFHINRNDDWIETLAASQNLARKYAIDNNFDYVLSVESDIFPPKDIIWKLLRHWKPVVGAYYMLGGYNRIDDGKYIPEIPCIFITNPNGSTRYISREEFNTCVEKQSLERVHGLGLGCVLIDVEILKKFPFWVDNRFNKASDSMFYMDLWNNKIPVYVDFSIKVEHRPNSRPISMYKKKGED